ncbi:MAG: bifunctional DNA primase/polymerase [Acidobacteria bacterium]|nr:bifunctional DNA primase/polymerase [Acidobacteriota bacterium]
MTLLAGCALEASQGRQSLVNTALAYGQGGWAVFPVRPRGKAPLTSHGLKDATTDLDQIRQWWARWPGANIGLAVPDGLLVVDVDSDEALHRLKAEELVLPATVQARTARGSHFWYRCPNGQGNRVGLFAGVDVRAAGGYVVVPPSVHPSGAVYEWIVPLDMAAIADAPAWLLERFEASTSPASQGNAGWARTISEPVPQGRRNQTLAQVAGLLFRRLPAELAAELAFCWAQVKLRPPLSDREVERTIDSIAGCELRRQGEQR